MSNKTYLPQIQRRTINRPNQSYHVLKFDLDNAYPQRVLELVAASPTAIDCWEKRAAFLMGKGFEEEEFNKAVINSKGLTVGKLLRHVTNDKALGKAFGIHVNYNANYQVSSVHYVRWEDIRIGDPDEESYKEKYGIYFDWGHKTWKNIMASKIAYIHKYNPDPHEIQEQVIEAGGWDKYKGQLYYFNPEIFDYSLAKCDSVLEDIETEGGIKIFNNRSVRTGFMPSAILTQQVKREIADEISPSGNDGTGNQYAPTQLEINLGKFQGAEESMKIMSIEYEEGATPPALLSFDIQNNDKLFEVTEKSVERRIIKGFGLPKELISMEKANGLSNGGEKREAIRQMNEQTKDERTEVSEVFEMIFSNFYKNINPSGNYKIIEMPMDVLEDSIGTKAGQHINLLLLSGMDDDAKKYTLMFVYGLSEKNAELMLPKSIKPTTTDQNLKQDATLNTNAN